MLNTHGSTRINLTALPDHHKDSNNKHVHNLVTRHWQYYVTRLTVLRQFGRGTTTTIYAVLSKLLEIIRHHQTTIPAHQRHNDMATKQWQRLRLLFWTSRQSTLNVISWKRRPHDQRIEPIDFNLKLSPAWSTWQPWTPKQPQETIIHSTWCTLCKYL